MCAHRDDGFVMPAIHSVLAQTEGAFEFIIVLNACPDSLEQRIRSLDDPRIVVHRTEIGQLAFNLNLGLHFSRGRYIVRFDADDLCHPERLRWTREILAAHPEADVVAGSCRTISEAGEVLGVRDIGNSADWRRTLRWKNPFVHPATTIRRDRLLAFKGYANGLRSEDYDLWLRMAESPDVTVVTSSLPMIDYRVSPQQSSGSLLGYAEVAGHMLRSLLVAPSVAKLLGLLVAIGKTIGRAMRR
ncbi:glycosyltransferase [Pseudorhodoferax sp.]|uniref:glycosyltransferase n=1 Tax=Pseudorhodoferax sp. TaxID=1993553 RepID=UPI0039E462B9